MGLVNINSKTPICRMGCVACIDEKEIDEEKRILLDIQNYPGNSGSPIISRPELGSVGKTTPIKNAVLIGIINSYIPYQEQLMNMQIKKVVEIRSENSGIAVANPVEFIKDVMEIEFKRMFPNGFIAD